MVKSEGHVLFFGLAGDGVNDVAVAAQRGAQLCNVPKHGAGVTPDQAECEGRDVRFVRTDVAGAGPVTVEPPSGARKRSGA